MPYPLELPNMEQGTLHTGKAVGTAAFPRDPQHEQPYLSQRMCCPQRRAGGLLQELHAEVAHPLAPVLLRAALAALPGAPQGINVGAVASRRRGACTGVWASVSS